MLPRKLVIIFLFLFFLPQIIFVKRTYAQEKPADLYNPSLLQLIENEKKLQEQEAQDGQTRVTGERANRFQLITTTNNLTCMIFPCEGINSPQTSALGALASWIGTIYAYPPASGLAYTHDLLVNADLLTKPAYAQGIGFAGLAPLLPLWKAFRNIAYAVLIIVMVAIGFMIIFRMKIDPKTVISIQAALPKIVITLLLITFSYPIAGFMIDLMYLVMAIVIAVLAGAVPPDLPPLADFIRNAAQQQQEFMAPGNWWKLFHAVFSIGMIPAFFQQVFMGSWLDIFAGAGIASILGAILRIFATEVIKKAIMGALAIPIGILILILGLGLLFTFLRLFMLLLNSYIQLLIAVILGPILILKEAIPGQSAFMEWLQNLIANLVVFPATVGIIYLSWIFTTVAWSKNLWGAPLIPSGGGGDIIPGNPLAIFIGLGIIFMAPSLVAQIKKAFHPKPALPVTAGTAFAPVTGAVQTGMGAMQSFYYIKMTGAGLPVIGKFFKGGE